MIERSQQNHASTSKKYDNDLKVAIQKLNLAVLEINMPKSEEIFNEFQQAI